MSRHGAAVDEAGRPADRRRPQHEGAAGRQDAATGGLIACAGQIRCVWVAIAKLAKDARALDKTFNIHEAKTNLSSLVAKVEAGEEIVIARAGKPVARLVPIKANQKKRLDRRPGFLKGKIRIGPDFDDPLPEDILAAFCGERD
ncbi:MAG: type II toxin-antitoxin system Phd/YefM family antitoxin [Rhizomicrobium sp.]